MDSRIYRGFLVRSGFIWLGRGALIAARLIFGAYSLSVV